MYRGRFNGKAASGTTAAGHAEDSQPNESINKRKQVAPPRIATVAPPHKSNMGWRGSYRGRGWPQTAIRGDKGWRGGRGGSSSRGWHRSSEIYTSDSGQGGSGRTHFTTYTTAESTPPTWNSTPYFMHQFSTQDGTQVPRVPQGQGEIGRPHFTTFTTTASPPRSLSPSNSSPEPTMTRHFSPQDDVQLPTVSQPRYHPPLPRKTASSTQNLTQPYKPQFARHSSPPPLNEISFNRELQQSLSPRLITPDLPPLKRRKLDTEHEILVKEGADEVPPPKPKPPLPKRSTRSGSAAFSSSPAFSTQPPPNSRSFEKELSPQVKAEPSSLSLSPPPPPPSRRLITESCTLFPIPDNCRKSYPTYYQNRKNLFREKVSWLAGFGLKKTRVFFRDDGMVVEWTSSTPVWSDTLMPEAPSLAMVIRSVHEANSLSPERLLQGKHASEAEAARASQELRKAGPASSKDHPKPKPSQRKFNPVPIPRRKPATEGSQVVEQGVGVTPERKNIDLASDDYSRRVRKEEDHATEVVEGLIPFRSMSLEEIHDHPVVKKEESPGFVGGGFESNDLPRFASEDLVTQTLLHPEKHTSHQPTPIPDKDLGWKEVSTVWAELDTVALAFIDRYIRTFDSDRSKLEKAYTKNAIFSARIHTPSPPKKFVPFLSDSRLLASVTTRKQIGRAQIIEYLNALGPHQFCPHGTMRNVAYTLMLHEGLVLMTVHGEVVNTGGGSEGGLELDHVVSLDQSFVLRRPESDGKEEEGDGDSGEAAWPLEALSHQMTVREEPLLCLEGVEEALPWVAGIVGGGGDGVVVDDEHEDL